MINDETLKVFWTVTDVFEEQIQLLLDTTTGNLHEYVHYFKDTFAEHYAIATDLIVEGTVPDELPPYAMSYDEWLLDRDLSQP